jgi:serine/threonine-protein kinase
VTETRLKGRYTLEEQIGQGGMGAVWLARDEGPEGFKKRVVVKRLLGDAAQFLDYFRAEARLVARLPHQNIVQVLDYFVEPAGQHNIVMEYVEGTDAGRLIDNPAGRLSPDMAAYIAVEALKGLDFAHTATIDGRHANLIHRDISPANVLVSYGAEVKITDFGVAKASLEYRGATRGQKFHGKVSYAPPEAFGPRRQELDQRADLYSLGVVLRELITNSRTFVGGVQEVMSAVQQPRLPPLGELCPDVSPALARVVDTLMAPDRTRRFASAREARVALMEAAPRAAMADEGLKQLLRVMAPRRPRETGPYMATPSPEPEVRAAPDAATLRASTAPASITAPRPSGRGALAGGRGAGGPSEAATTPRSEGGAPPPAGPPEPREVAPAPPPARLASVFRSIDIDLASGERPHPDPEAAAPQTLEDPAPAAALAAAPTPTETEVESLPLGAAVGRARRRSWRGAWLLAAAGFLVGVLLAIAFLWLDRRLPH